MVTQNRSVDKIVTHSKTVLEIAIKHQWMIGACYTNTRNIASFSEVHFIDINWKNYNYYKHLDAVKVYRPKYTVARDWETASDLNSILRQADSLLAYSERVIIVPKVNELKNQLLRLIPAHFMLGYSVPTRYGGTDIEPEYFGDRDVHLLGGRPEKQRDLAKKLNVVSIDGNRFTLDAAYGDYFLGEKFVKHPHGGYVNCIVDSIKNIDKLWVNY